MTRELKKSLSVFYSSDENGKTIDRRVRKTRSALTEALIKLMAEKPFKSITVKELTDLADVNRATFYVHYKDIYDMLEQTKREVRLIAQHMLDDHMDELSHGEYVGFTRDLFSYFDEHGDLYALMLGENGDSAFLESALMLLCEHFFSMDIYQSCHAGSDEARKTAELYQFAYICGGLGTMIKVWLSKDPRETVDQMARMSAEFMKNVDARLYMRSIKIFDAKRRSLLAN
jgi:AcrR family transcriptional regulator